MKFDAGQGNTFSCEPAPVPSCRDQPLFDLTRIAGIVPCRDSRSHCSILTNGPIGPLSLSGEPDRYFPGSWAHGYIVVDSERGRLGFLP